MAESNDVPRYRVVHPHPQRHSNLLGQAWEHGVLKTDDAALAKSLTEYGCQVYEGDSQRHALGTHMPSEQDRIEKARRWAFPDVG